MDVGVTGECGALDLGAYDSRTDPSTQPRVSACNPGVPELHLNSANLHQFTPLYHTRKLMYLGSQWSNSQISFCIRERNDATLILSTPNSHNPMGSSGLRCVCGDGCIIARVVSVIISSHYIYFFPLIMPDAFSWMKSPSVNCTIRASRWCIPAICIHTTIAAARSSVTNSYTRV
jgi:hypothetical protein